MQHTHKALLSPLCSAQVEGNSCLLPVTAIGIVRLLSRIDSLVEAACRYGRACVELALSLVRETQRAF
eukprot:4472455-Amphidinium_carterae.1